MFSFHHYKTFFLIPDILLILKFTLFDIDRATPTFFDRVNYSPSNIVNCLGHINSDLSSFGGDIFIN